MDIQKVFEFVCTANQGRSPVAELIAGNYLRKIGADDYSAISSGTNVAEIKEGREPESMMFMLIRTAKKRGDIYTPAEAGSVEEAITHMHATQIRSLYEKATDKFCKEELEHRAEMLKYFGIEGQVKQTQDQTIARPDTLAVLTMAESNKRIVQEIYDATQYKPKIIESMDIPNAFGKGIKAYKRCIEIMVSCIPTKIDKILG